MIAGTLSLRKLEFVEWRFGDLSGRKYVLEFVVIVRELRVCRFEGILCIFHSLCFDGDEWIYVGGDSCFSDFGSFKLGRQGRSEENYFLIFCNW